MTLSRARELFDSIKDLPIHQIQVYPLLVYAQTFLDEIDRLKHFEEWYENKDYRDF